MLRSHLHDSEQMGGIASDRLPQQSSPATHESSPPFLNLFRNSTASWRYTCSRSRTEMSQVCSSRTVRTQLVAQSLLMGCKLRSPFVSRYREFSPLITLSTHAWPIAAMSGKIWSEAMKVVMDMTSVGFHLVQSANTSFGSNWHQLVSFCSVEEFSLKQNLWE